MIDPTAAFALASASCAVAGMVLLVAERRRSAWWERETEARMAALEEARDRLKRDIQEREARLIREGMRGSERQTVKFDHEPRPSTVKPGAERIAPIPAAPSKSEDVDIEFAAVVAASSFLSSSDDFAGRGGDFGGGGSSASWGDASSSSSND